MAACKKIKRNELDGLVYARVRMDVFLDGKSHTFEFPIKHYHEIIRYNVLVQKDRHGALQVLVKDADYAFKKTLY